MEKFAVDLDKVLDDFELQEDQAEQFVKNGEKLDCLETEESRENFPELLDFITEPLADSASHQKELSQFSNLVGCEDIESKSPSTDAPESKQTETSDCLIKNELLDLKSSVDETTNEHSNLNELLLDLSEALGSALVTEQSVNLEIESSTLLDQSFTEDVVTQPLLSDIIQNGAFNPSHPDTLTDDELESYLAELEKEEEGETSEPTLAGKIGSEEENNHIPNCSPVILETDKEIKCSIIGDVNEKTLLVLPLAEEEESVPLSDSEVTSTEESNGSSFSDSDSSDAHPNLHEDSFSTEEEMPQLIDDPCLLNTENVSETVPSQITVDQIVDGCESNPSHMPEDNLANSSSCEVTEPVDGVVVEDIPAPSLNVNAENNVTSVMSDFSHDDNAPLEPYSSLTEDERLLGVLKPVWIPDEEAPQCMNCSQRFTVIRRRHHCRACGRVLCSNCCSSRARLEYMESKETRVCLPCLQVLRKVEAYKKWGSLAEGQASTNTVDSGSQSSVDSTPTSSPSPHLPNPVVRVNVNNPSEYCSTVPPALQVAAAAALPTPTVMVPVPVGVLKKEGTPSHPRTKSEPKQVIFSDGIRPGGDLAELDAWRAPVADSQSGIHRSVSRRVQKKASITTATPENSAPQEIKNQHMIKLVPSLPPIVNGPDSIEQLQCALADPIAPSVVFAMQSSQSGVDRHLLLVRVKLLQLDCCVRRKCWSFATCGMRWVAQDEIVILLEQQSDTSTENSVVDELLPPEDIFYHLLSIYEEAMNKHHVIINLGHTVTPGTFLGSTEHGGFLFFRTTFQCVQQLSLPPPPYLVGVLLQRWEIPWAKVFPLRLLLRLGAEFRYYPCPLFSVRKRKSVFGEVGHTIVNLLADMRNFSYSLPAVAGLVVHMEEKETNILLPKSRYQQVCKALAQSNDHVISLAASFSPQADAHLVCLQLDDGSYQTQAINIHTRPRKVTGASFLVLNGALKSSSGLSGRSSIVEDGVMVQLLPDMLSNLKQALIRMENYTIQCGKIINEQPEETVTLKWVDTEPSPVNTGVQSPIDGRSFTGISSIRVMQPRDFKGEGQRLLRWTELFIIKIEDSAHSSSSRIEDNGDITRFAETVAKGASMALAAKLASLDPHTLIGLRVSLDGDSVEYQTGAGQAPLPNTCVEELDSSLIPILHRESSGQSVPCIMELWFQIVHP
ncbi:zinc finger FYVE domain-containing protein 9-like [Daphnia carinata]|uniref:zinc finger FYVE domain-containing protein 9-like n=1 Tax=Daphnia carinata TaxID=120202 RepID=UPI0025809872|nr:zinc finger FYVE domain-containing protein 9-like [Daphnia carinata]